MKEVSVLIVDDSRISYTMLKNILAKTNFKVCDYARNSNEAVEKYQQHKPDLITMDMNLPGQNGIETSRRILEINPQAKILMISAMKDAQLMTQGREVGISSFLQKPVVPYEFIDTLLLLYQNEFNTGDLLIESYIHPLLKIFQNEIMQLYGIESKMSFHENIEKENTITGTAVIIGLTGNPTGRVVLYAADTVMIALAHLMLHIEPDEKLNDEDAREAFAEAGNIIVGNYVSQIDDTLKDKDMRISPPGMIRGHKMKIVNLKMRSFIIVAVTDIGELALSISFAGGKE
ncbi:Chemotaxis phosphatase CheX [Propionispira arboris]|uniref:Chemotaxis phosphatase CheX n=1 Tax=Propionispira arboris TaxID=84035 RepID=A0A1H6U1G5_9FIRM|nr:MULTISPECIES: response regulator [Propionispira]SEI86123.1 Chemotaxis phosphatase CheX [Propionispira arboris]